MPLYPFTCEACGAEFEELVVRMTTGVVAECPSCGSDKTSRRLAVPAKTPVSADFPATLGPCGVGPPCGAVGCRRISPT